MSDIVHRLRAAARTAPEWLTLEADAADEIERLRLRKRPIAWMRYVNGAAQFQHSGDPPEDEGWIALYRRGQP